MPLQIFSVTGNRHISEGRCCERLCMLIYECLPGQELANGPGGSAAAQRRSSVLANKPVLSAGFVPLARHPYGCRVVQRILEKCTLTDYKHRLVETVRKLPLPIEQCSCISLCP